MPDERWTELLDAAREALRGGEHSGPCDPDNEYDSCDLHVEAANRRRERLQAAVSALS